MEEAHTPGHVPPLSLSTALHEPDPSLVLRYGGPDLHLDYALAVDNIIVKQNVLSLLRRKRGAVGSLKCRCRESGVKRTPATPSNSLGASLFDTFDSY